MSHFQIIPIYLASDSAVTDYFRSNREEADALSGRVVIFIATEVAAGDAYGIVETIDTNTGKLRYPGLTRSHLPCFWLEDAKNCHEIIELPDNVQGVKKTLSAIVDACATAQSAAEAKRTAQKIIDLGAQEVSPIIRALERRSPMNNAIQLIAGGIFAFLFVCAVFAAGVFLPGAATERIIAEVCGIVFVIVMLGIAVLIPNPTLSQERVFRIVLALAGAGFVVMTPGFLEVQVSTAIKAGGALAVFVILFFYSPASLVVSQSAIDKNPG